MTKLSGTSGQAFSGLAESLSMRGTSRSGKTAGAKSPADASFNDLLHTVSSLAKKAIGDGSGDTTAKAGSLRTRLAQQAEKDTAKDDAVHELTLAVEEPQREAADKPAEKSVDEFSDKKIDKSSEKHGPVDHAAKPEVQDQSTVPAIVAQELAAAPVVTPQLQAPAGDRRDTSTRDERSSTTKREVQGTSTAKAAAADSAPSAAVPTVARAQAASSQMGLASSTSSQQGNDATPKAMPGGTPGFEAVTANVERAAKASAREALPEATKVTVLQQETHMPPVQFSATQQVANAVVAELKESAVPAASTAPDPATSQTNAPEPLKILTINLEPPALGNVTVRLRLVGSEVSVHLAAARKDTSQMLDQQRDSIRDLMQSAGYVADVAPVQHGSLDGFQSGSGQPQPQLSGQQQSSSQSQGSFGGTGTSSGQSDDGAKQARQERQSNQETRHDQDVGPQLRRGPVYL